MMIRLWTYLRGYAVVRLDGGLFSRFFHLAMQQRIALFQITVHGNRAHFKVPLRQYRRLRAVARKSQCRMRVAEKHGFVQDWRGLGNKTPMISGIAVFAAVLILLGNMVLTVRIKGDSTMMKQEILATLADSGLKAGMFQQDIDLDQVVGNLLIRNRNMTWVTVYFTYGTATIEFVEGESAAAEQPPPVAIVATRRAQIKAMDLFGGKETVSVGQTVEAGAVLAVTDGESAELLHQTFSKSKVFGITTDTVTFALDKNHVNRAETGRMRVKYAVQMGDIVLPLSLSRIPFRYYDTKAYIKPFVLFGVELPALIHVTEIREIDQSLEFLTKARAEMIFAEEVLRYERAFPSDTTVLERKIEIEDAGGRFLCAVTYICYENIGEFIYEMP